jgi:signal peptidase II
VRLNRFVLLAAVAAVVIALDQVSKAVAFGLQGRTVLLGGVVELYAVKNTGAAFGILRHVPGSAAILTVTTIATIVLLAVIFRPLIHTHLWGGAVALGLIYGGALGNLADRVGFGYVRDFIKLDLKLFQWPAFNPADVGIVLGIILLLFGLVSMPRRAPAPAKPAPVPPNGNAPTAPEQEREE